MAKSRRPDDGLPLMMEKRAREVVVSRWEDEDTWQNRYKIDCHILHIQLKKRRVMASLSLRRWRHWESLESGGVQRSHEVTTLRVVKLEVKRLVSHHSSPLLRP